MQRFLSFGYLMAVLGGLLLATGSGVQALVTDPALSVAAPTTAFAITALLRLSGAIAILIGLTAIYVRCADRAGRFGLAAYALVVANFILQAGWMWADLFVAPTLASVAPGILDGTVSAPRLSIALLTAWFMNASIALLGVAVLRARTLPRTVGISLLVMGVVTLIPLPVDGPVYETVIGAACVVAGVAARRGSSVSIATAPMVSAA